MIVYESSDCILSVVKNWCFWRCTLAPIPICVPFPRTQITYNVKRTWREQSSWYNTIQYTLFNEGEHINLLLTLYIWPSNNTAQLIVASSKVQHYVKKSCTTTKILPNTSKLSVDFPKIFLRDQKNCYVPSFFRCLAPGQANVCAESPPISIVSRLNRMGNFNGRHFFSQWSVSLLFKRKVPKVLWEKGTSRPRRELRIYPTSCPFVWAPSWKVRWRHHISSSGCGPDCFLRYSAALTLSSKHRRYQPVLAYTNIP